MPLATAGAVTGEVTLTGGERGQFYSDRTGDNIVTIEVADADRSLLRFGTGRAGPSGDPDIDASPGVTTGNPDLVLGSLVIAGELSKTDRFDGGPSNPVCFDGDDNGTVDRPAMDSDTLDEAMESACASKGDALLEDGDSNNGFINVIQENGDDGVDESADNTYRFTLKKSRIARDANDDGIVDGDDFTVRVNNSSLAADGQGAYFTFEVASDTGRGVTQIVIHGVVPNDRADSVQVTYEYSEYVFAGGADDVTTPLNIAGSRVFHGDDRENLDEKGVIGVNSGGNTLQVAAGTVGDAAEVTFAYHVRDTLTDYVDVTSTSSQGAGDVTLDGTETGDRTSVFRSAVALVSSDDYNTIKTESERTSGPDDDATTTGDEDNKGLDTITEDDEVDLAELLRSEELEDILVRIEDIIDELDLESCRDDAGAVPPCVPDSAEALVDRLLSVSHGDTITVTYPDKNARRDSEGSVVKTAEVDMEAPVVTLVRPTDKLFTKEEAITLQADVVDTGAGVERDDIVMIATTGVSLPGPEDQLKSPIVSGFSVTGVPTAGVAEGKHTWAVLVMDKVGNTPDVDIEGTEENEGARGAAAPDSDITDKDEVANPFEFTVDTNAPTLETGKTGISLKNPGIASGDDRESEKPNQRDWVRVEFDLGSAGGAAIGSPPQWARVTSELMARRPWTRR